MTGKDLPLTDPIDLVRAKWAGRDPGLSCAATRGCGLRPSLRHAKIVPLVCIPK